MTPTPEIRVVRPEGHCASDAAWSEFVQQYAGKTRADFAHGTMSDFELANAVYMADRNSLDLLAMQTAAKERIRWLSIQLAQAIAAAPAAPAPEPVAWQRRHMWPSAAGAIATWEQCPKSEATGHFEKSPGYEYRPLYAAPVTASAVDGFPAEISREILGFIVDEVFGGAIEDASVIEDIYRVIAPTPPSEDSKAVRVRACMEPGQRWRDISSAAEGVEALITGYQYNDPTRGRYYAVATHLNGYWYDDDDNGADLHAPTHYLLLSDLPPPPAAEEG